MLKYFFLFVYFTCVIACKDYESGDVYAGKNSMQCHQQSQVLNCIKYNPLSGPVGDISNDNAIFGNGEIEEIDWESTLSWFLKSYNHHYGFDIDPLALYPDHIENGQDVYVSVKSGERAKIQIRADPNTKDIFHLHKINDNKQVVASDIYQGSDICDSINCLKEIELSEGDYAVYYGDVDKNRYIHIIGFSNDIKKIDFIQYGEADNPNCFYGEENGCYIKDNVEESFNDVFSQAVVEGNFENREPIEFNLDDILFVNLTEPMDLNDYLSNIITKIVLEKNPEMNKRFEIYKSYKTQQMEKIKAQEDLQEELNEYLAQSACTQTYQNLRKKITTMGYEIESLRLKISRAYSDFIVSSQMENWSVNIVFGINEMSIGWDLSLNEISEFVVLQNYSDYNNACTKYYKITYDEGCLNKRFPMYLISSNPQEQLKFVEAEMIDFNTETNTFSLKLYNLGNLSRFYQYTLAADIYPIVPGFPYAIAYAAQIPAHIENGFPKKNGPAAVIGGLVWGAHASGQNSYNILNHEIAHTYGMSDAYMSEQDPYIYKPTDETNLMNYAFPIGSKIAYRQKQVVYSSSNERIMNVGKYATESQWLCIRDKTKCVYQ